MEKYSTFSGLTSIQAINLICNKQSIPELGSIGDYIKSGDHLTCDISSLDMWLDVKIEAEEVGLVIFLEIKIYKNQLISSLKKSLLDIGNQIFHSRSMTIVYEESEAELKKIQLAYVENNLTTESCSVLDQSQISTQILHNIDENTTIENEFDYLDRYVNLQLAKKLHENFKVSEVSMRGYSISDSLLLISSSAPVRNLRVEPQVIKKIPYAASERYENNNSAQKNCPCILL